MKKKIALFLLAAILVLSSCTNDVQDAMIDTQEATFHEPESTFSIQFLDVGQGDSALVECDGRYMLIDGGDTFAGDVVYDALERKAIQHLDILAFSHTDSDHIGGLRKALTYASDIDLTIGNQRIDGIGDATAAVKDFRKALGNCGATVKVPDVGDTYKLGSAEIEVIDVSAEKNNDSLVLLVTYGDTRFLFTGDIEAAAQKRISDKYANENDEEFKIDLIKMPHHGAKSSALYRFIRTFMPDYAVISVGKDNQYQHPHADTLDLLRDSDTQVYRTDESGTIMVKSNGRELSFTTAK